ncbi:peroxiredoxin [Deinococcus taeanensis]|uniref:peroxiredoxin n=1 Tax=Deinococcus taeanensis TaxID=2737050 RepID=UPI001CDD28A3|nr:peroxiredoxin [Deinococcus taeanensis]UBV41665.1 peroxiredoxin [Deinococcus taeanensis]
MSLTVGDKVEAFTATTDQGARYDSGQDSGTWRVVFFFPHAAASHCQLQARRYQAHHPEFAQAGVKVLGVSSNTRKQQLVFRDVCQVSFPLITDEQHRLSTQFGVLDDPLPELSFRPARRETFLIGPDDVIVQHWQNVNPETDASTVLEEVRRHLGQSGR